MAVQMETQSREYSTYSVRGLRVHSYLSGARLLDMIGSLGMEKSYRSSTDFSSRTRYECPRTQIIAVLAAGYRKLGRLIKTTI